MAGPHALVRDIVLHIAGGSRAMERFRIDYCCGGEKTLEAICAETHVGVDEVLAAVEEERQKGGESDAELLEISLRHLLERIVAQHHGRSRSDAATLISLSERVRALYAAQDPSLAELAALTKSFFGDLARHLDEEEKLLFPYVVALERAGAEGLAPPVALFASVRHIIEDMKHEHERCEEVATKLRALCRDYVPSEARPLLVSELFLGLEAHEKDLFRHMHIETNVVFPRAERLETKLRTPRRA